MEFSGQYEIAAPPQQVWAALNDPDVLRICIPGCETLERVDQNEFRARVALKIGPMKATFQSKVLMTDMEPPSRCVLRGEGQGGVAGFVKGEAAIHLDPTDGGTTLIYKSNATVGGKLAQMGQRIIDGATRQLADDFFDRLQKRLARDDHSPEIPASIQDNVELRGERDGIAPEIWVVGLITIVAILLVLFGVAL